MEYTPARDRGPPEPLWTNVGESLEGAHTAGAVLSYRTLFSAWI